MNIEKKLLLRHAVTSPMNPPTMNSQNLPLNKVHLSLFDATFILCRNTDPGQQVVNPVLCYALDSEYLKFYQYTNVPSAEKAFIVSIVY